MICNAFTHFGTIVANTVAVLDLQQVIFGGGIFKSNDIIAPILLPAIDRALPSYMKGRCEFGFSTLNGAETLLGAALLPTLTI
jgi:predicted NBD/HSP70 family sugar kinase